LLVLDERPLRLGAATVVAEGFAGGVVHSEVLRILTPLVLPLLKETRQLLLIAVFRRQMPRVERVVVGVQAAVTAVVREGTRGLLVCLKNMSVLARVHVQLVQKLILKARRPGNLLADHVRVVRGQADFSWRGDVDLVVYRPSPC